MIIWNSVRDKRDEVLTLMTQNWNFFYAFNFFVYRARARKNGMRWNYNEVNHFIRDRQRARELIIFMPHANFYDFVAYFYFLYKWPRTKKKPFALEPDEEKSLFSAFPILMAVAN